MAVREGGDGMGKRAAGEGTIRQRPNGTWEVQLRLRGQRVSVYGATQKEARAKAEAAKAAAPGGDDRRTVKAYLEAWLEQKRLEVRPSTWSSYERHLRVHVMPALGALRVTALTPADVRALCTKIVLAGGSPAKVRDVLRAALAQLVEDGVLSRNPAAVSLPEYEKREARPLTVAETRRLLKVLADDSTYGILMTLILTAGLRRGEALGVRVGDVGAENDILHVRTQLVEFQSVEKADAVRALPDRVNARWLVAWTSSPVHAIGRVKSAAGVRELVVQPALGTALAMLAAGRAPGDLLFTSTRGGPIFAAALKKAWRRALKAAGLDEAIRIHDGRHTVGSALIEADVDIRTVQAVLGHSDPAVTAKTYTKVREASMRRATAALGGLLREPPAKKGG